MFLRNSWYVFGWSKDFDDANGLLGRVIIGEPIVVWRDAAGTLHAMEDRCPHRHAPMSRGRIEGQSLRCMYHGMAFGTDGKCIHVPLLDSAPDVSLRVYPVAEKNDWIWVWTGESEGADESLIPDAFGISDPAAPMLANSIEYAAHYQLIHDNLCDLSHLDFVHATTLQPVTGTRWSDTAPRVLTRDRAVRFERWFENANSPQAPALRVDVWSTYDFAVPGIFIMRAARYPAGTAAACNWQAPGDIEPLSRNIEQQAVTPITATRTAYHFATGLVANAPEISTKLAHRMDVVLAAFAEDRDMIEAQQKIWDLTPQDMPRLFLPQDKGPFLMRKMLQRLIDEESSQ